MYVHDFSFNKTQSSQGDNDDTYVLSQNSIEKNYFSRPCFVSSSAESGAPASYNVLDGRRGSGFQESLAITAIDHEAILWVDATNDLPSLSPYVFYVSPPLVREWFYFYGFV